MYTQAIWLFHRVVSLRGEEPQSYRDLAVALLEDKQYQKSIDTFWKVCLLFVVCCLLFVVVSYNITYYFFRFRNICVIANFSEIGQIGPRLAQW